MEFEEYVVARRTRLVEQAVGLGVAPEAAPGLVDQVLDQERRAIARSEDPDPHVQQALRVTVLGDLRAPRRRRATVAALVALVALVALGVVGVLRQVDLEPPPVARVPTTYTLEADGAEALLSEAGYVVETREVERCETPDQVIGTEPGPGVRAPAGSTVVLLVARPPGLSCPGGEGFRATVWQLLRWVGGFGDPPALVERPTVVRIDASGTTTTRATSVDDLTDRIGAGELLGPLRDAVAAVAPTASGFPDLRVRNAEISVPCAGTPPPGYDELLSVRFDLDLSATGSDPCPLTGYLLTEGELIATIVLLVPPT